MKMDNIKKIICYTILGMTLILTIVYMGGLCIKQKKQEQEFHAQMKELQQKQEEAVKKQEEALLKERLVLVDALPVFSSKDVSINKDAEPKLILSRGDIVILEAEGTQYSLVKNKEGNISGYVWSDCIGEKSDVFLKDAKVIVIDAGHQGKQDKEEEPIGPGADETKAKVSSGTDGVSTKRPEHETVLDIALELEKELERRGYIVVQVRRDEDVKISNAERAVLANQINADILIRLHGNGAEDSSKKGADAYYISDKNPYVKEDIYDECKKLAECVLDAYTEKNADIKKNSIHESDNYTGLNWCKIPSVILEMGYLSNENDDKYLNSKENLETIAKGIADGIDEYFKIIPE